MSDVLILGAGAVGQAAAAELLRSTDARLLMVDLSAAAVELAVALDPERVVGVVRAGHDAVPPRGLVAAADVVLNTGPMQLALPLVRGLVSQGVSLLDLGPFHTDTQQILDLHDQATSAYSEIITGCGVAPGLTNLVVHEAARAFDSVDSVVINSLLVGDAYLLPSAISDRAGETTVPVAIVDGRPTKLDPAQVASRTDEVDFRRFGTARVTPISHAEPATLARSLGVPAVMFRSGHPCTEDAGIALLRSLGLLSDQTPPGSTLTALAATKAAMSLHGVRSFNAKLITLHGIRHGAAALDEWFFAAEAAGMSATGHLSGFVAAQAVRQVLGRPRRPGAWAPEQALDPAAMIAAVRHHDQFIIEPAPARAGSQEYA